MMYPNIFVLPIMVAGAAIRAQINLHGLPACATTCLQELQPPNNRYGCALDDLACIYSNENFKSALSCCVNTNCSVKDQVRVLGITKNCNGPAPELELLRARYADAQDSDTNAAGDGGSEGAKGFGKGHGFPPRYRFSGFRRFPPSGFSASPVTVTSQAPPVTVVSQADPVRVTTQDPATVVNSAAVTTQADQLTVTSILQQTVILTSSSLEILTSIVTDSQLSVSTAVETTSVVVLQTTVEASTSLGVSTIIQTAAASTIVEPPAQSTAQSAADSTDASYPSNTPEAPIPSSHPSSPPTVSQTQTFSALSSSSTINPSQQTTKKSSMSSAAIGGIVVGVLAILLFSGTLVFSMWRRKEKRMDREFAESKSERGGRVTVFSGVLPSPEPIPPSTRRKKYRDIFDPPVPG